MQPLTEIQTKVFEFIQNKLVMGESAPTHQEITSRFRWKSTRAAACHVAAIIRKGWLISQPGKARSLRLKENVVSVRRALIGIPILGSIPAGFSQDREAESGECVSVAVDTLGFQPTRNTFALRVVGDSMIGAHICEGDIVVFEHGPEPRHGQIVAALIDGKSTLKTFLVKNKRLFLKAENPRYPDLIPSEELMIQGVFRALIRKAKE